VESFVNFEMEREQFSINPGVDAAIYECFPHLDERDVKRFKKKFRSLRRDEHQSSDTLRELIFGAFLGRQEYRVRAFQKYDGLEPDWSVFDERGDLFALADVTSFHPALKDEAVVRAAVDREEWVKLEIDEAATSQRFYQNIKTKCGKYKALVKNRDVPFVIGCFPSFINPLDKAVVRENLHSLACGLFRRGDDEGYPDASGLVVFDEKSLPGPHTSVAQVYVFEYFQNPYAVRRFAFPVGNYYPPMSISRSEDYKLLARALAEEIDPPEYFKQLAELPGHKSVFIYD
jgi:hypothetical protein